MILTLKFPGGAKALWRAESDEQIAILKSLQYYTALPEAAPEIEILPGDTVLDFYDVDPAVKARTFPLPIVSGRSDLAVDNFRRYGAWMLPVGYRKNCGPEWSSRQLYFLGLAGMQLSGTAAMVHGGLAISPDGEGVIFCGPSGIGKSTLMGKLAVNGWNVLADDCFLLSRAADGSFMAKPSVTWSVYTNDKPKLYAAGVWHDTVVKKFFLLERNERDCIAPVDKNLVVLGLMPSFSDMIIWHTPTYYPEVLRRALLNRGLEMAEQLARQVESRRLLVSLGGKPAVVC